jgi:hypothetical protein
MQISLEGEFPLSQSKVEGLQTFIRALDAALNSKKLLVCRLGRRVSSTDFPIPIEAGLTGDYR